jgi:hypothetical protein
MPGRPGWESARAGSSTGYVDGDDDIVADDPKEEKGDDESD